MTIGTNIKNRRIKLELSLEQLARKVSTVKSTIWNIENNKHIPNVYLANDIAKALKTTIGKLLSK